MTTQTLDNTARKQDEKPQKTTGEKYYSWLKFGAAEVFILGMTAVIAYVARYVKSPFNLFKHIQDGSEWLLRPLTKIGKEGGKTREIGTLIAAAGASTMVTSHGGNAFALPMKWLEDRKIRMVNYFNRKFGKPGEEEEARERLEKEPGQTWGDVIKGRLVSYVIVVASFFTAMVAVGKDKAEKEKPNGMFRFAKFEEGFGRWFAGLTKGGKELNIGLPKKTGIPITQKLEEEVAENKAYRFGKILALDIFATTAAIIIWNVISALSAKKRGKKTDEIQDAPTAPTLVNSPLLESPMPLYEAFADRVKPAQKASPERSYTERISKEKTSETLTAPSL